MNTAAYVFATFGIVLAIPLTVAGIGCWSDRKEDKKEWTIALFCVVVWALVFGPFVFRLWAEAMMS